MYACDSSRLQLSRRDALKVTAGTAMVGATLLTQPRAAEAQTMSDIDALNFMLNIEYLLAQFLSTAVGIVVPTDRLAGDNGRPGVAPIAPAGAAGVVTFTDFRLRTIVQEMASDNRQHLIPMRQIVGAPVVRQPLMNISAAATAPFSVAMQRAGVVAAGAAFDPYASEENLLYAIFLLKNVSVAGYRSLAGTITNRTVTQNFTGLLGAEAIHAATIRSYLYARGATESRYRENADRIAAFQRSLNGGDVFQGISASQRSFPGGSASVRVANAAPAQASGETGQRSSGQLLNQLYLTAAATSAGGFFPEGVNGTIRTSASA